MRTQRKILFQVFAQNKGNIVNLLAVCIVVLVGLATFSSCSEQKEQLNNKRISDGKKDQKSVSASSQEKAEETDNFTEGQDIGNYGDGHEYIFSPGSDVFVEFKVKLEHTTIEMLGEKPTQEEALSIKQSHASYWSKLGVKHEIELLSFEAIENSTTLWGIQSTGLSEKMTKKVGDTIILSDRSLKVGNKTIITVSFPREGDVGIITKLPGYYNARDIGNLQYEELSELLGGFDPIIKLNDEELIIEELNIPMINYYVTLEARITLPDDYNEINTGCRDYYNIGSTSFFLEFTFDPDKDNKFHIFGPWDEP
ncbi:MAG: hypothetical protein J7M30_15480 [Deltaproteobacteria bacterium]|nr:hypothetical protein [Deltaproteobacteria bacterium]